MGVKDPLQEAVCPLLELEHYAGRSAVFTAVRQGHLSLLKLHPQPPLPPGALSQGDGGFIYKYLTEVAVSFSEMPCPERRNLERQSGRSGLAELQWAPPNSNFPVALFTLLRLKLLTHASAMADGPPPTKLEQPRSTSYHCASSENFKPVDLCLLGSVGVGPAEPDPLGSLASDLFLGE